jgi:putative intracellular protease/amidase
MAGGHGTCADFDGNAALKGKIEELFNAGKIVAAVCHGPMALPQCEKADGTPLVAGLAVAGFSNAEEKAVGHDKIVPFLLESKLVERGAKYESGPDWQPKVVVAGNLITGQNPASSESVAAAIIAALLLKK